MAWFAFSSFLQTPRQLQFLSADALFVDRPGCAASSTSSKIRRGQGSQAMGIFASTNKLRLAQICHPEPSLVVPASASRPVTVELKGRVHSAARTKRISLAPCPVARSNSKPSDTLKQLDRCLTDKFKLNPPPK